MDFFIQNLREKLEAINKLIDIKISIVNTKRVRKCHNPPIKSSNRSKINFVWRALKFLEQEGILVSNGQVTPRNYKIKSQEKIDIDEFINQIDKNREKIKGNSMSNFM